MKRAVALLGEAEVKAILEKEGRIEVRSSCILLHCLHDLLQPRFTPRSQ